MATKQTYRAPVTNVVDFDALMARLQANAQPEPAPATERGMLRGMADIGLSVGQGAVGAVKSLTDLGGADNAVSQGLGSMSEYLQDKKSDQSKATMANSQARIKEAEATGDWKDQAAAYMNMLWDQPGEMIAQGVGSFAPMLVTGPLAASAKLASAAKAAGMSKEAFLATEAGQKAIKAAADVAFKTNMGVGAAQGVGTVKGAQFEQTFNAAKAQGKTDEEAAALATEAQAYGGAGTSQQLLGGVLGAGAAATGPIERLIAGKAGQAGQGVMARTFQGAVTEAVPEGLQGGQERYAGNTAAIDAGVLGEDARWRGVVGQGLMEGAVGGLLGGGAGALNGSAAALEADPVADAAKTQADALRATKPQGDGPLSKAVGAGIESEAQKVEAAPVLGARLSNTPMADMLGGSGMTGADPLAGMLADDRQQKESNAVRMGQFVDRNQAMLTGGGLTGNADPIANMISGARESDATSETNIRNFAQDRAPMVASDAARILDEAKTRGMDFTAAPHPEGGFMVVPRQWVTPAVGQQAEAEIADTLTRMAQVDASPVERAPRARAEAVDLTMPAADPVRDYMDGMRKVNTPAAKFYVSEFDAGRITPADVQQRMQMERGKTPDERLADAAAQAPKSTAQPGDILNPAGQPFKTLMSARLAAKKTPGDVIEVVGGYSVRPKTEVTNAQASPVPASVQAVNQGAAPSVEPDTAAGQAQPVATAVAGQPEQAQPLTPVAPAPLAFGRNGTPLSEGGKPFKTKAEADTARKLQPMMRVKKEGKGFVLVEKTPAQIAAQAQAARRLGGVGAQGKPLAAHEFLASDGGLNISAMSDLGFDRNVRIGARWLFTKTGKTLEAMTEALQQSGYMQGTEQNQAIDLVKRSATGKPQYTADGWDTIAKAEAEARFEDHLAAQQEAAMDDEDFDPFTPDAIAGEFDGDDLVVAGYDAKQDPIKMEVNALLAQAEALGIDTDTIKETAYEDTKNESEQAYYERVRDELTRAINASLGSRSNQAVDGNAQQGQGSDAQRGSRVDSREGDGREGAPGTDGEAINLYGAQNAGFESAEVARIFEAQKQGITKRIGGLVTANAEKRKVAMRSGRRHNTNATKMIEDVAGAFGIPATNRVLNKAVGVAVLGDDAMGALAVIEAAIEKAKTETTRLAEQRTTSLTSPTQADIESQQDRSAKAEREAKAKKQADDERARIDRERKEIAQASVAAAGTFELGGNAEDNLTGQQDVFGPLAKPEPAVSANTIFTEDAAARARERLRKKLGQLNSGLDPEMMMDGITLAGYHIEKGARTFSAYARAMLADLGDGVKPYLQSWYMAVRADPRSAGFKADMDKASVVEDLDVDAVLAETKTEPSASVSDSEKAPKAKTLTESLYRAIQANQMPKDNPALKKLVEAFDGKAADPARMKQAQEELETAIVMVARDVVAKNEGDRTTFDMLLRLYESQPNLNIRTSTSIANQAYSTPAPLAWLASRLAGVTKSTVAHEPTGGTGMLMIAADPKKAIVNELNDLRIEALKSQGFTPTQKDAATQTLVPDGTQPDALLTNPPFGSVKDSDGKPIKVKVDGFSLGQIDHLIAARALNTIKDDGRATLILGANKVAGGQSTDDRIFFNWLYSHYNVTGHFEVDGDLYNRQGAGWPVRVITINGRKKSDKFAPVAGTIQRVDNWNAVYEQFTENLAASTQGSGSSATADTARARPASPAATPPQAGAGRPEASARGNGDVTGARAGVVSDRAEPAASTVGDGADEQRLNAQSYVPQQQPGQGTAEATRPAKPAGNAAVTAAQGNEFQSPYTPRSARKDEGVLIPANMAQPTQDALSRLEDEVGDIDEFARKELGYATVADLHNALMGLQVDSVATSIHQIKQGKAVVIADQTGIGKGRQAASIIRWAARHGMTPVFVSVKPSLFTDMYGDLADIGTSDVTPFIMNGDAWVAGEGGTKLFANKPGLHKRVIQGIANSGKLPEGSNALFMTYSQINVDNVQRRALMALAPNAVFVLDESHNAAGASSTGEFVIGALEAAKGVVYLSATYAKRPDNMPLYFKTDIGDAAADTDGLAVAMASGGLPLQTVVSNNLVKAGQMFRRERSYDGVSIASVFDSSNRALHERMSNEATKALRAIVSADRMFHEVYVKQLSDQLAEIGATVIDSAGNQIEQSVQHTEFSSVVHNFVKQMLLGLKAQSAADEAIASLKRGEKPIIAVENTMGSFLNEYAAANGIGQGDSLGSFDYRTVLTRALARSRVVIEVAPNGDKVKRPVRLDQLDEQTRAAYQDAQQVIDGLTLDIPVSPIDWMRSEIIRAGYKVAEITGRNLSVDYGNKKKPVLSAIDSTEQKDKVNTTRQFNSGNLDALILNVAGSTGISLHASEKFDDQRQRHMIVAQAAGDINIFMQMLGRVHRTGQVRLPKYTILSVDLPTEKRPTAVLSIKMKSLNANTSSNTESATSVKSMDILNKYGDQIVNQYLRDNYALARALELTSEIGDDPIEDIARKATGRLALQPIATQHAFYDEVEAQYSALIDYLNKTNQNDLEPRTFDFDAKEIRQEVLFEGPNKNTPFGEDAIYGEYSIKAQGTPMKPEEIQSAMTENLGGLAPSAHVQKLLEELDSKFNAFYEKLEDGSKSDAANVRNIGRSFLSSHRIGSTFRVDINSEPFNAVVLNVRNTHKETGNPYSLSKIQVSVAVNGALRSLSVPATQFSKIEVSSIAPMFKIEQLFKEQPPNQRETAKIVTGNLLAAYGELQGVRGTIITFTKQDGTSEQGILLPKLFDYSKNTRGDYRLQDGAAALKFLQTSDNKDIGRFGVMTRDGNVRVLPFGQGIKVQVPKSKLKGGKYFLDKGLIDVGGDFVTQGPFMVSMVQTPSKAVKMLDLLMKKQALYALPSMAEEAKQITGDKGGAVFSQNLLSQKLGPKPTLDQIERFVQRVQDVAKNVIPVTVVGNPAQINVLDVPAGSSPSGALIDGRIYLFADNIKSVGDAYSTLFHEIFHLGLQKVIPAEAYSALLKQFAASPLVARYVRQWKQSPEGVQKARTMPAEAYDALATEEALAMVSETLAADQNIGSVKLPGLVKRMLAWFAQVADRLGFPANFGNWMRGLTQTAAERFVSDMTRAVLGGEKNLSKTQAKYGTQAAQLSSQNRLRADSLNSSLSAREFFVSSKYAKGLANKAVALADAADVMGFDLAPMVVNEKRPDLPRTPMRYGMGGVIYYNQSSQHSRHADVQYMIEEILHSIDHVGDRKTISASSKRLAPGGDLRIELESAYQKSAAMRDILAHPLAEEEMTETEVAAELYARSGMIYYSNPQLLQIVAPRTYDAHHTALSAPANQGGLSSPLRQLRNPGVQAGESVGDGARIPVAPATLTGQQRADELRRIRRQIAESFGASEDGAGIRFHGDGDSLNTVSLAQKGGQWDGPLPSKWDDYVFKLQDKHIDLKRVTQAITKWSGKLADGINVYLQEELYHGRTAKRVQDFTRMELEPALKQLAAQGFQLSDLEEYMHARHAKEANRVIAERNPDVDGLQDGGSGMKDAEADAYFAKLPKADAAKLAAVAAKFDEIMAETNRLMVEYELEPQSAIDSWGSMFKHYVPLHREDKGGGRGMGQGFSIKGRETKGRTGSTRKVVDIISHIAAAREKTVVRGEKNRVAQALVGLVTAHPNQDFWKVGPPESERVFNPKTGVVEERVNPLYKSLPNVVMAKVAKDGVVSEVAVTFNEDDARAVRMASALKNLDTPQIEGWLGTVSKMTRYFASINTQYNPVFGVVNLVRDVQGAMINLGATELADQKAQVAKDAIRALTGIYKDIRATRNGGVASSEWSKLYEQFQHDGGQTGFRDLFTTPADRTESLKNVIDPEAWAKSGMGKFFSADGKLTQPLTKARGGFGVVFNWLSDYNEAMENGVRLAAYKAALDKGMTRQQAASLAKNLTVNFNRKGLSGTQAGAVYAFFNAAMQGTARIGEALMTMEPGQPKTLRLTPFGKKVVYGGVLLGSVQALALAAAGFDDDEPKDFVRERSLIIPTGGKSYITIPMPLGLHVIPNVGRVATEFALGGFKNPVQRAAELGGLFADAFNPIGNAGLSMQTLAPTVLDPLVALTENKDWTGNSIARVSSNKDLPGFTQYKDSASAISKFLAEAINTLTGGNQYVAGVLSPTPDQIDYLAGQLGGGVWREISKVEQTVTNTATGEEVPLYKVPLLGRFVGTAAGQSGEGNAFYSNANKLNRLETEIKGMEKDGKLAEARALRAENPESRLIAQFNRAERQIQKLRGEKRAMIESGADTAQVKAMDQRITTIMKNMNKMMATTTAD